MLALFLHIQIPLRKMVGWESRTLVSKYGDEGFPDYLGNSTYWFGRTPLREENNIQPIEWVHSASFHPQSWHSQHACPSTVRKRRTLVLFCVLMTFLGSMACTNPTAKDGQYTATMKKRSCEQRRKLYHGTQKCHMTSPDFVWQHFTGNVFCISTGVG